MIANTINDPICLQRWNSYEFIGPGHVFHPVDYADNSGWDNNPYIWSDDTMWTIDTPESPHSILPLLLYFFDLSLPPINLNNTQIELSLRGDNLDLKGGHCLFWILSDFPHSNRWHLTASPLKIAHGKWEKPNKLMITDKPDLWHNSFCMEKAYIPDLTKTIATTTSCGISFIGFKEKVTGKLSLSSFRINDLNHYASNWPYSIGKEKSNCGWKTVCKHQKKQIDALIQPFSYQDNPPTGKVREIQGIVCQENFLVFSTATTTFCYLIFAHTDQTTKKHDLTNAVVFSHLVGFNLDLKKGGIVFFIEHAASNTRWIYTKGFQANSKVKFILSEDVVFWHRITGEQALRVTLNEYDYLGFMIISPEDTPTGTFSLIDFSIGPNI